MALPTDANVETAIATIEQALKEVPGHPKFRQAVGQWRGVLAYIESLGGSGYDALAQDDWSDDQLDGA